MSKPTDDIRNAIVPYGTPETQGAGDVLISRDGGLLNWLLDLRQVFLQTRRAGGNWPAHSGKRYQRRETSNSAESKRLRFPLLVALLIWAPRDRVSRQWFIIRKEP